MSGVLYHSKTFGTYPQVMASHYKNFKHGKFSLERRSNGLEQESVKFFCDRTGSKYLTLRATYGGLCCIVCVLFVFFLKCKHYYFNNTLNNLGSNLSSTTY